MHATTTAGATITATALLGLLGNNTLSRRAHILTENCKSLLLTVLAGDIKQQSFDQGAQAALPAGLTRGIVEL